MFTQTPTVASVTNIRYVITCCLQKSKGTTTNPKNRFPDVRRNTIWERRPLKESSSVCKRGGQRINKQNISLFSNSDWKTIQLELEYLGPFNFWEWWEHCCLNSTFMKKSSQIMLVWLNVALPSKIAYQKVNISMSLLNTSWKELRYKISLFRKDHAEVELYDEI